MDAKRRLIQFTALLVAGTATSTFAQSGEHSFAEAFFCITPE